ncbi:spore germination protein [Paenibacillus selenitireducens]|uniref:Spore germination protein n=1 Tax=Paenibacillus selenitireducens TaxID=1324314 RepID=A0A1T2XJJ4_9BACL|nr:spore germination protein [Paenibacillus selenitireducens]OPA80049.1 spore germination protein [Paenibacillus selenitireducens]
MPISNNGSNPQGPTKPSTTLTENIQYAQSLFQDSQDFMVRQFTIQLTGEQAAILFLSNLTDKNALNNNVLYPLMYEKSVLSAVAISHVKKSASWDEIISAILLGSSVLFIDKKYDASILDTQGWPQRSISDPQLEASLKGGHQGFVETGSQNIALIRRFIPNLELKVKEMKVGQRGSATVTLLYLEDVIDPGILTELEERIQNIQVDAILNTGELEEYIEDNTFSPFPQFIATERPDAAASHILQGRVAIIVDRSPIALIGPTTFNSFFQSVDDYSSRWIVSSFIRSLRFLAFFIAIFLPALYIALISYNYVIIPINLILSIGASRERVPFPPFIEAILMEITLEMLREAGIRLPAPIGQTVGIVGGIVIGQAAVQAGIVSNIMVIIVAATAISSFIIPSYDMGAAIRFIRFPMMILASLFGIFGITIGFMMLMVHLITLDSLGTPYGSPYSPVRFSDWKDSVIRLPLWLMKKRPVSSNPQQLERQTPSPTKAEKGDS